MCVYHSIFEKNAYERNKLPNGDKMNNIYQYVNKEMIIYRERTVNILQTQNMIIM